VAHLVAISPNAGHLYRIDGTECLLGRRLDCHVHIDDQRVSRRHARVRREGDTWQLDDLGSSNGTYVNGRQIQNATRLRHGDEIEIGAARFRVDLADEMVAAAENASVLIGDTPDTAVMSLIEVANLRGGVAPSIAQVNLDDAAREAERLQRKLAAMYKIAETVASTLEPRVLLDKVVGLLLEVFPQAASAVAVTLDGRSQQLRTQATRRRHRTRDPLLASSNMNIPQRVVDRVLRQRHSVLLRAQTDLGASQPIDSEAVREAFADSAALPSAAHDPGPIDSENVGWRMGAPLAFHNESLGILHVEAEAALGYFDQNDLDLLDALAAQAGVALHLIGLHQRLLARERLDYDLRLARQIQRNLLPREPPRVAGLDFAVHYEPAFHVGGDFYDFLWLDARRLAIVVGDVSGKAVSGALFMARVTSDVRAATPVERAPHRVLQRVNRALAEVAEDGMFTTMVYLVLDLDTNTLRFANAGHTAALLVRNGSVVALEEEHARTMPLGIEATLDVGEAQVELRPGDTLMLYTDGIIEARSLHGTFYGVERLQHCIKNTRGGARATLEAVLRDVDRFVEQAPQADDQTMVCLTVTDTAPRRVESLAPHRV
jgi:serine phosphatase RsbU (regulator of sigma subunit)